MKSLTWIVLALPVALSPAVAQNPVATANERLDINSADVAALDGLPSFARFEAEAVVQYRERNGPFASIDDLKSVPGVSGRTIENVRGELAVGPGSGRSRLEGRP